MSKAPMLVVLVVICHASVAAADSQLFFTHTPGTRIPIGTSFRAHNYIDAFGDAPVTVTRIELSGPDASHFQFANASGPCSEGQVCEGTFVVIPQQVSLTLDTVCQVDWPQRFVATVTITSNAVFSPTIGRLECDGAGPHIDFDPRSLTFPTTRVGYWSAPQVTHARATDGVVPFRFAGAPHFRSSFDRIECDPRCFMGPNPAPISIAFAPQTTGAKLERLGFNNDDGSIGPALSGTAFGPGVTFEAPTSGRIFFGAARLGSATPAQAVRIRNTGDEPLHISSVFMEILGEPESFSIVSGPVGPLDVAPNGTVEWQVACRPVELRNDGALRIENDAGFADIGIPLSCIGESGRLELGTSIELPGTAVGSASRISATIRNTGTLPVVISAIASDGPDFTATPHGGSFPITLASDQAASFDIGFAPTRGGRHQGKLTFVNDGPPFIAVADGFGLSGRAELDPIAPAFGNVPIRTTAQLPARLANNSDQLVVITSVAIADPAFAIAESLVGTTIVAGFPLSFTIQATPTAPGLAETEITFMFDRIPATTVQVTANGAEPELAVESWDEDPLDGRFDFGRVRVRMNHTGLLSMTNIGTAPLRIASCALVGDAAFSLSRPCAVDLAAVESADLEIEFAPMALGRYDATLQITSDTGQQMLDVPVSGVATPRGCVVGRDAGGLAVILLGPLAIRRRSRRWAAMLASRARSGAFAAAALLASVAGCSSRAPDQVIAARGGGVTVIRTGTGDGTVESLTPAIDCGTQCSATFEGAIHLAAVASPGSTFAGWEGACAGRGPCVVRESNAPAQAVARFDRRVHLTITGEAASSPFGAEVVVNGEPCALPCTRDLLAGTTVTLDVFTLSTFTGWTGGCTLAATTCTLVVTADTNLVAHFATPGEKWTAIDHSFVPRYATVVGDDPMVAGEHDTDVVVARYSSAGLLHWRSRIAVGEDAELFGFDHNDAGQTYFLTSTGRPPLTPRTLQLHKLDTDGQALWSVSLGDVFPIFRGLAFQQRPGADGLVVLPNGDVVVLTQQFVRAYRDDGNVRWTQSFPSLRSRLSISAGADGIVYAASEAESSSRTIDRYDADGQFLGQYGLPELSGDSLSLNSYRAFTVAGNQLIVQSGNSILSIAKLRSVDAATGRTIWLLDTGSFAMTGPMALAVDGQGAIVALDAIAAVRKLVGRQIVWRRAASHLRSPGDGLDATEGRDIAGDSQGRVIEVGSWIRCTASRGCGSERVSGFVRVFDP